MSKQINFYFLNKKRIVAVTDYNFRTLEEANQAMSYMCAGASVIGHKKVGAIAVIPAEWMKTSYDSCISSDFYHWDVINELTPDSCAFQSESFTERARFFALHPELPPTKDEDKALLKLHTRKQAYQDAVMFFRHGDGFRAYFQDAYLVLGENPDLPHQWHDYIEYVSFGKDEFQNLYQVINKAHRITVEDDCIIPEDK